MKYITSIGLTFWLCALSLSLAAQQPHPAWHNYTSDDGLPSQEVHCILQDSKGYLWFGTDNGLSRFDGYSFQNFGPREGLYKVVVFELLEDPEGRIWINTMGGHVFFLENDSIHPYRHNDIIQQYRNRFNIAQGFHFDSRQTLYTCLEGLGILEITLDGQHHLYQCKHYCAELVLEREGFSLRVLSPFEGNQNVIVSLQRELYLRKKKAPVEFFTANGWKQSGEFETVTNTGYSKIFPLGNSRYLLFSRQKIHFIEQYREVWNRPMLSPIITVLIEEDGSIYLCLRSGEGFQKYASVEALRNNQYEQFLDGYTITRAYLDRQGGHWFSTTEGGVFYTPRSSTMIYDEKTGLPSSFVTAVEPTYRKGTFIGLHDGSLHRIPYSKSGLEQLPVSSTAFPINDLYFEGQDDVLWIAEELLGYIHRGKFSSLNFWDEKAKRMNPLIAKKFHPIPHQKKMWTASYAGVSLIGLDDRKVQVASSFGLGTNHRFNGRAFTIHEGFAGNAWLGLENGLFDWNDGQPQRVPIEHPAFKTRVEAIAQLPDSTLAIGSKGHGVALWKGNDIRHFTTADGLTADMVENIHVDERGQLWVGTLNGLNKLVRKGDDWTVEQFTTAHGLPSNSVSMVKAEGENIWVATDQGLAHFKDKQNINTDSPPPIITSALVGSRSLNLKDPPELAHSENNVTLHFVTFNYRMQGKVLYRYRVDGTAWATTLNTSVNFPSLSSGSRLFEVQSQNEDGVWSEAASFEFRVAQPWWASWWFVGLSLGVFGMTVFWYFRYRTGQVRKEAEVVKKLAELERTALRAQMNPHFIFNSLNAISAFINIGDKIAANQYLSRFSKLIRAALQHSRTTQISLQEDLRTLENYLELERMRFQNSFDYHVHLADDINAEDVMLPPQLVQPFVENAIVHGLATKKGKGQIDLNYRIQNEHLLIMVTDNGIGIETSKKQKSRLNTSHKSVGITVTARRLEMLNGEGIEQNIKMEELKNAEGGVAGTRVTITVPLEEY